MAADGGVITRMKKMQGGSQPRTMCPAISKDFNVGPYELHGKQEQLFGPEDTELFHTRFYKNCQYSGGTIHHYDGTDTDEVCVGEDACQNTTCDDTFIVWDTKSVGKNCGCFQNRDRCKAGTPKSQKCAYIRYQRPEVCPHIGGTVQAVDGRSPKPGVLDPTHAVVCKYDPSQIASSCEAASDWHEKKRCELFSTAAEPWWDEGIMETLCSKRAPPEQCPDQNSPYRDEKGPICSMMITCPLCRQWALDGSENEKKTADNVMSKWCSNVDRSKPLDPNRSDGHTDPDAIKDWTKTDPACRCMNASLEMKDAAKIYPALAQDPGCWFSPCTLNQSSLQTALVPSVQRIDQSQCKDFCAQIIDVEQSSDVDIHDITFPPGCSPAPPDPDKPDDDPDKPEPEPEPEPEPGKKPDDTRNWWEKATPAQKALLVSGSITTASCLVGALVYLVLPGKKGEVSAK